MIVSEVCDLASEIIVTLHEVDQKHQSGHPSHLFEVNFVRPLQHRYCSCYTGWLFFSVY